MADAITRNGLVNDKNIMCVCETKTVKECPVTDTRGVDSDAKLAKRKSLYFCFTLHLDIHVVCVSCGGSRLSNLDHKLVMSFPRVR